MPHDDTTHADLAGRVVDANLYELRAERMACVGFAILFRLVVDAHDELVFAASFDDVGERDSFRGITFHEEHAIFDVDIGSGRVLQRRPALVVAI